MSASVGGANASKDVELGVPLDSAPVKQRAVDRNVKIAMAVAFYFTASMALVLLNKRMFSTLGKEFPLFVTWWQFVVALAMIAVGGHIGKSYPQFKFFVRVTPAGHRTLRVHAHSRARRHRSSSARAWPSLWRQ